MSRSGCMHAGLKCHGAAALASQRIHPPTIRTRMAPCPLVSIIRGQGTPAAFSSSPLLMMFL